MTRVWKKPLRLYLRLCLVFSLLLQAFAFAGAAGAEESGDPPPPLPSVTITFDTYSTVSEAGLEVGGAQSLSNVSVDSGVYHGDAGKSIKVAGRTQMYSRLKVPQAFGSLSMASGKQYNLSMWVKVGASSSVTNGYFFLSVVTYPGAKQPGDPNYYFDTTNYKFLVGKDGWTKLTLPYTANGSPVYGVAVEQISAGDWTVPVPVINIDDVVVEEVPPPTHKLLTFDTATSISNAGIGVGGGQATWNLSLDNTVVHGVYGGKSVHIVGRTELFNRVKINNAFTGLDMTPGTQYNVSLYAKADATSTVKAGYFYLSVIDIPGTISTTAYYSDKNNYRALVTDDDWVKITLPYTVGYDPLYGIAIEQMSMPGYSSVVGKLYIDTVEVEKTGMTTEIPPSRIPPPGMKAVVDGKTVVYLNGKPEKKDGVPFLQLPKTFSVLRADVTWDAVTQTATAVKNGRTSQVAAGGTTALVNGSTVALEAPPYMKDGVLMVPASYVEDALEATVAWDAEDEIVTIVSKKVNAIHVDKSAAQQEIWGFGATANDPVNELMGLDSTSRQTLLDTFFGTTGDSVGFNLVRLEINPFTKSDPNPRNVLQASIHPAPDVWDFDTDTHQRWFADEAISRNPNVKFAGSVWSPPAWMKDNASEIRGGHLKPEYYDEFADYLLTWAKKYKEDYGYDVNWISIQNEPEANVDYASAIYNGSELSSVVSAVYDAFKTDGIAVQLGAPEGGHLGSTAKLLGQMTPEAIGKLDYIGTHFYAWDSYDPYNYDLRTYDKPLFMMEYCMNAPNDGTITGGLSVADQINAAMEQGYSSYLYWLFVSRPATSTTSLREGLVNLYADGTYAVNKRLYAMGQFSRFFQPGDRKVEAESGNSDVTVSAAKNTTTGKAALVATNSSTESVTVTISGLTASSVNVYRTSATENIASLGSYTTGGGSFTYTLAPQSITTFAE